MTAKPQPMAGQSDADDLIAELAKLMAQDANDVRPSEPARPAFSLRIPGGTDADGAPQGTPSLTALASDRPAQPAAPAAPVPTPAPAPVAARPVVTPQPAAPQASAPSDPFHFDFDLDTPKRVAAEQPAGPSTPVNAPVVPPVVPAPSRAVSAETIVSVDHDSIADLIAAELLADPEPQRVEPTLARPEPTPTPRAEVPAAPVAPAPRPSFDDVVIPAATIAAAAPSLDDEPVAASAPKAKSASDRFKFPPVFGLGSRSTPAQETVSPVVSEPVAAVPPAPARTEPAFLAPEPKRMPIAEAPKFAPAPVQPDDGLGLDPIDEIESLIGNAMRVEFDQVDEPAIDDRPAPSPALRSLATPTFAPEANAPKKILPRSERKLSSADEAILAAAEASGADIGWVDAADQQTAPHVKERRVREKRSFHMSRALAGPLVAITLLLAAGFGLYFMLGLGGESGPAPLLTADAGPVKETPVVDPNATTAQQSVVFNEIDGVVPGAEEQLVSRDQADVNEVRQIPPTTSVSEEGLANRKVRTVTVRPDGTIVSGEDSLAGSAILPVDRPNVPAVAGAQTASPELQASAQPVVATPAPVVEPAVTVTPVTPGSTVPAVDLAGNAVAGKTAPVPLLRPARFAQSAAAASPVTAIVPQPAPVTAQTPVATTPVTQPTEVAALPNNAPAYVQLASQRTEADARNSAQAMVTRFGPLFGGANMEVQRVDLGDRGIYYRVRVPANSLQEATTMCNNVKAAGGDCFTM
ncbi:SPOR domain-containing protein [Devosia sp. 2618]|uniref:SPOR domain-containing protein n=1 Tax=Devosia sp. 2618 TaxID=3156454 RepID=UPI00339AC244